VSEATPTLYEWAGGADAIRRMIDAFYDRVEADELLSPSFEGSVSEEHRDHVAAWWSEVSGGPGRYTDELGGYESMLAHHRGLRISPEAALPVRLPDEPRRRRRRAPGRPEFRAALVGYLEWGTRLAMQNSQEGAEVAEHAPVPRWGWGVAPPYQPD
jgi:hemoglobin